MELEWDEVKRQANLRKHGLDFDDAKFLEWDNATVIEDTRFAYSEPRYWAFARWNGRLHMVAFCIRGDKVWIISFRKVTDRETRRHGKKQADRGRRHPRNDGSGLRRRQADA